MTELEARLTSLEAVVADLSRKVQERPLPKPVAGGMQRGNHAFPFLTVRNLTLDVSKPLLIHNPKTGGRALHQRFRNNLNYFVHTPAQDIQEASRDFSRVFSFAFVRNPYARFLSAFYFTVDHHHGLDKDPNVFCKKFASSKMDWILQYRIQHPEHFLTQGLFVKDTSGRLVITRLYRYEDMPSALRDMEEHGLVDATSFPVQYGKSSEWSAILDTDSRKIIREAYACDFDLYEEAT